MNEQTIIDVLAVGSTVTFTLFLAWKERRDVKAALARTPRVVHEESLPPLTPGWAYREGLTDLDGSYRVNRGSW